MKRKTDPECRSWFCKYCNNLNQGIDNNCRHCGLPLHLDCVGGNTGKISMPTKQAHNICGKDVDNWRFYNFPIPQEVGGYINYRLSKQRKDILKEVIKIIEENDSYDPNGHYPIETVKSKFLQLLKELE